MGNSERQTTPVPEPSLPHILRVSAEDESCMKMLASKDEQALITLYDRYSPLVFALSWFLLQDQSSAEDVMHSVFLTLWQNPQQYKEQEGGVAVWLTTVTHAEAEEHIRQNGESTKLSASSPADLQMKRARQILAQLPPDQRVALELFYFGHFTHAQIATQIYRPMGVAKMRLRRGLASIGRLSSNRDVEGAEDSQSYSAFSA